MLLSDYKKIIDTLKSIIKGTKWEGHIYSVGGCERDRLMGREIKDIDLVIDLPNGGIEFAKWLFSNGHITNEPVIYENFGTAMFHLKSIPGFELEAVQTRKECYRDANTRDPETAFGTINDDCTRRDFTYNAIYYNISEETTHDFNGGNSFEDLKNNMLRTCGDPDIIYKEDPLRILRCIRFSARFNSTIEKETMEGMKRNVERLEIISHERIQKELDGILSSDNPGYGLKLIDSVGALHFVFPNLFEGFGNDNLVDTAVKDIEKANSKNPIINLAVILRYSRDYDEDLKYLKYSNHVVDYVKFLRGAVSPFPLSAKPMSIRKFHHYCGTYEKFQDACTYMVAEIGHTLVDPVIEATDKMIKEGIDMFQYTLPINGEDVMKVKNIGPSEEVKHYLYMVMDVAYINPLITKEECYNILIAN